MEQKQLEELKKHQQAILEIVGKEKKENIDSEVCALVLINSGEKINTCVVGKTNDLAIMTMCVLESDDPLKTVFDLAFLGARKK